MRIAYLPLALTFLVLSKLDAATFQIASNLDNTFNTVSFDPGAPPSFSTTVEAPFVGSLTLSYDAANPLTNGSYAWNSLSNLQLAVLFPGVGIGGVDVTFNQSHLDFDPAGVYIQVVDGNFFFTNSNGSGTSISRNPWGGSANFVNNVYLFTTQPLDSTTRMGFGGYVVEYNALYQLVRDPGGPNNASILQGNYGNPTDNLAVPEPSALSLLAVGMGGWIALRRVRRRTD